MNIATGNANTINFNGNVSSTATSTGLTITASSGTYNFNGATNTFSGAGGITISNGESGTITFSSGTAITTTGTPFTIAGAAVVSANIMYSGTINKTSGGTLLNITPQRIPPLQRDDADRFFNGAGGVVAIISNVTGTLTVNTFAVLFLSKAIHEQQTRAGHAGSNRGTNHRRRHDLNPWVLSANGTNAQAPAWCFRRRARNVDKPARNSSITTRNAVALSLTGLAWALGINSITVAGGAAHRNVHLLSTPPAR